MAGHTYFRTSSVGQDQSVAHRARRSRGLDFTRASLAVALVIFAFSTPLLAATASDIARSVREAGLDPAECYRVRDLHFSADRAKFFFADGYLILGRPVNGHRISALFSTEVEGGDGEVLLLPPNRAERQSLAGYTGSQTLDEHFTTALMMFSPEILDRFMEQINSTGEVHKSPEMGMLLDSRLSLATRNITASFDVRLTWSLLAPESNSGFFAALVTGRTLGNFDFVYDPLGSEQLTVGATVFRDNRTYFDTWTNFAARDPGSIPKMVLSDYRISATVRPDLSLAAVTRFHVRLDAPTLVLPIEISRLMTVTSARIDGEPAEVLQHEDLRAGLIRIGGQIVLAVASKPIEPGREHEIEIHHEGRVIIDAGNQVYYVASRSNWYPLWGTTYSTYDLTFRVPKNLQIVLPGQPVTDTLEGDERITHHRIETPVRTVGFNLGVYEQTTITRSGFTVDVYANRAFERAMEPRMFSLPDPGLPARRPRTPSLSDSSIGPPPASPIGRLQALASSVAGAMDFFSSLFGPPPLRRLEVTPVPGFFGQGFPGLIYLSTMSYLSSSSMTLAKSDPQRRIFFEELLQPHETAHQWWGNVVFHAGYHDEWITESLANYSALLYLDKRHGGRKVSDAILASYRDQLVDKDTDETGPITQGRRLETSLNPDAWRAITYGKGTWILHMLRWKMGDAAFLKMLSSLRQEYERKEISTSQFRLHCKRFLPPTAQDRELEAFFDEWVYGTGIPQLKITWTAKPGHVTGAVTQSGVHEGFVIDLPIEIRVGPKSIRKVVRLDSTETAFAFPVAGTATKVTLDPDNTILRKP